MINLLINKIPYKNRFYLLIIRNRFYDLIIEIEINNRFEIDYNRFLIFFLTTEGTAA